MPAENVLCIQEKMMHRNSWYSDSEVPPTINLDNLDDEVADLNYVPNKAEKMNVDVALTNSFGFGGHNAVLIYKKYN